MIIVVAEHYIDDTDCTVVVDTQALRDNGQDEYADILEQTPHNGDIEAHYGKFGLQSSNRIPPEPEFPCKVDKIVELWSTYR